MLSKAKSGALSTRELDVAVEAITRGRANQGDLYTALHVVGLAGSPAQAPAVRQYLRNPSDPMLSRLALQVLGDYWGMSSELLPELRSFLAGVDWDADGDVRDIAISITGRHLRKARGPADLAQILMNIADDDSEFDLAREAALRALATGLGDSLLETSSPAVRVHIGSAQAVNVLARARKRYARQ
ncbi:hypothetical protein ACFY7C_07630 [Streptomyces sp. NPDC012769]|uniref:hypothetical protein n=1 Tax=Streptomyces sp. NPDC012769 TaxID=3364848 RepID=UPI0036AD1A3A